VGNRADPAWARPRTLHEAVRRTAAGVDSEGAIDEFVDHVRLLLRRPSPRRALAAALRTAPPLLPDPVQNAYVAAIAAHLAHEHGLTMPRWVTRPERCLARPWFALPYPWARAMLLRDSPAAFRERNLFTGSQPLARA
jgi:hypothetical protein